MGFETAGYQLQPVLPELVLAVGAMVLLMLGAYRGQDTTRLVNALAVCLLVLTGRSPLCLARSRIARKRSLIIAAAQRLSPPSPRLRNC